MKYVFVGSLIISNDSHLISFFDLLLTFPENTDLHVCFTCEEMDLQEDKWEQRSRSFGSCFDAQMACQSTLLHPKAKLFLLLFTAFRVGPKRCVTADRYNKQTIKSEGGMGISHQGRPVKAFAEILSD